MNTPRQHRQSRCWIAGLLAVAALPAQATTITCPPTLLETPVVDSMLAGWEADVHAGRRTLSGAAIQVTRGSDHHGVAPDGTQLAGHDETATWTLAPTDGEMYWVACSYGNTSALLLQRVPEKARHCVARSSLLASGRHMSVESVQCD